MNRAKVIAILLAFVINVSLATGQEQQDQDPKQAPVVNRDALKSRLSHLNWLANIYEQQEAWENAIRQRESAVLLTIQLHGEADWRAVNARLAVEDLEFQSQLTEAQHEKLLLAMQLNGQCLIELQNGDLAAALESAKSALAIEEKLLEEDHPSYITTLGHLALIYQRMGDYARAEPLYLRCRENDRRVLGEQHPDYATNLNNLADLYRLKGDYAQAEQLYLECLDIEKNVLGDEHIDYAVTLNNLADLYRLTGVYAKAEPLYPQCLSIIKKVYGEEHAYYAVTLSNQAALSQTMGEFARAEPLYLRSRDILKKVAGTQNVRYAAMLNNLAVLYKMMGEYAKSEENYLQCQKILEVVIGVEHPEYLRMQGNLAVLYQAMGDYDQAKSLFLECKEMQAKVVGEEHIDYARTVNNFGALYKQMGDYVRAEPLYLEGRGIYRKAVGEEHPDYATILSNLGALYETMGDPVRALPLYLQCRDIQKRVIGVEHAEYARTLNNLAGLYEGMGDVAQAESLWIQCRDIQKKVHGVEHPDYANTLNNLAGLYENSGKQAQARQLYLECQRIQKKAIGVEHPAYARTLNNLAGLYDDMGEYAKAESLYLQCRDIQKAFHGKEHPDYATTLNNLASLYESMGDYARAEPLAADALTITRNHLRTTSLILSERQQLAMSQIARYQLDSYLSLAIDEGSSFRSKAARQALIWKGATLARQREMRLAATDPEIGEQFKQLQLLSRQLASLSRVAPNSGPDDWKKQIRELTAAKERIEAELSQKSAAFRDALKTITPELIQASIPVDAVLVDFLQYTHTKPSEENKGVLEFTPSILAVVARRQGEPVLIELGPKAGLAEAIDQWRETFGMSSDGKKAGAAIRKQIWEPLLNQIEDAKTVLVSTDGVLGRLPIAALPGKEPGTYLIEDHRIALIPVPQLLPVLVNAEGTKELTRELLLLGDVDYDADENQAPEKKRKKRRPGNRADRVEQEFERLDGAAGEIAAIQVLYEDLFEADEDDVRSLKRANATEAAFKADAAKFRFLHLATHGFFASAKIQSALGSEEMLRSNQGRLASTDNDVRGMNPDLLSGLALAGANLGPVPGKDDGILTAQEIAFLPLDGVETAVLSACETGLGEVAGGEGLIGIQRAFQVAGVRTTVASLWKVDDQATRVLMERFYRNLWEKEMGHLDALREAQLYILNNPDSVRSLGVETNQTSKRASPKLWAAFQISGYWE